MHPLRAIGSAIISVTFLVVSITPSTAGSALVPLKTGPLDQTLADANTTYLTWSEPLARDHRRYNAWSQPLAGGTRIKMNSKGSLGFPGGINGNTTETVYQEISGGGSWIGMFDMATGASSIAPRAVNTTLWEWAPSASSTHLLFGRNNFRGNDSLWKVLLFDRVAKTTVLLDWARNRCSCIYPEELTEDYATWTKCVGTGCNVWYYDIAAETKAKVPNPGREQYYAAVSSTTGNIYYASSGPACGEDVHIMRWNPALGGDPVSVVTLDPGFDLSGRLGVAGDGVDADDVILARASCTSRFHANIYMIEDAQAAVSTARVGPASSLSGAAKREAGPDARP